MEVYSCTHGQRRDSISRLWSSVTVEAGVNFLSAGYRIATGNVTFCKERHVFFFQSVTQNLHNLRQGSFPVDQFLYGILQKPAKGLGLLAVDQLLNIPQIHVLFANGKTVTAVYFYLQALWFILGLEIAVIVLFGAFGRCRLGHDPMAVRQAEFGCCAFI